MFGRVFGVVTKKTLEEHANGPKKTYYKNVFFGCTGAYSATRVKGSDPKIGLKIPIFPDFFGKNDP